MRDKDTVRNRHPVQGRQRYDGDRAEMAKTTNSKSKTRNPVVSPAEPPKLLVADDHEQNLYLLQVLLESHGYEVVLARDGSEALKKARGDP